MICRYCRRVIVRLPDPTPNWILAHEHPADASNLTYCHGMRLHVPLMLEDVIREMVEVLYG